MAVNAGATLLSGLAAWGGTAISGAGAGSILLAGGVALAGGFAFGTGLEKAQQSLFGNSIFRLAGDAAHYVFGPANQSTIDSFSWLT